MPGKELEIKASKEVDRISAFIGQLVRDASANGVVVALSGGIDSSVVGALCVKALGKDRVLGLLLPSDHTPEEDMRGARVLADSWGIKIQTIPISDVVRAMTDSARIEGTKIARANAEARTRMTILYYFANTFGYLVAGTGDRSEAQLGYFCYDSKTRVVTTEGLRKMTELKAGDTVFSLEPKSREMVEAEVEDVFIFGYHDKLVHFTARGSDLMVTPNHRMLVQSSSSNPDSPAFLREARECLGFKKTLVPLPSRWNGKAGLPTTLPVNFEQIHIHRTIHLSIEDSLYMFGLFIGDGNATKGKVVVPVKSRLSRPDYQSLPRDKLGRFFALPSYHSEPFMKEYDTFETYFALPSYTKHAARENLLEILQRYKIGYSLTKDVVRISSKGIYDMFVQCGDSALNKHIPRWLLDYPSRYLVWLLLGLKDSDASHAENQNVYYTSSQRLKDDFVELCFKLGRKATVAITEPKVTMIKGKEAHSRSAFEITFARKSRLQLALSNDLATEVDYAGKVWCPSVPPNENILVERNGRYLFSGNTKFGDGGVDFLPIAHLYKTQVRELGAHLGLPKTIVDKPASPQLWPGQKATDEIPAEYEKLDVVLHYMFDLKAKPREAAAKAGVPVNVAEKALEMHKRTGHKRSVAPSLA